MISDKQYQAVSLLRSHVMGREIRWYLTDCLTSAREVYETEKASESNRRLVLAYKTTLDVLFNTPMEDL